MILDLFLDSLRVTGRDKYEIKAFESDTLELIETDKWPTTLIDWLSFYKAWKELAYEPNRIK